MQYKIYRMFIVCFAVMSMMLVTSNTDANGITNIVTGGGRGDVVGLPDFPTETYGFTARMDANGNVSGQIELHFGTSYIAHGEFDCLVVDGNTAWLGGRITQSPSFFVPEEGYRFIWQVRDNGQGNSSQPDEVSFLVFVPDYLSCSQTPDYLASFPATLITEGNIRVD